MLKTFRIHYCTAPGGKILMEVRRSENGVAEVYEMTHEGGGMHSYSCSNTASFLYRYVVSSVDGRISERHWRLSPKVSASSVCFDIWRSPESECDALTAPAFRDAIFGKAPFVDQLPTVKARSFVIMIHEPRVSAAEEVCVVSRQLINWDTDKVFRMTRCGDSLWAVNLGNTHLLKEFEFKFGICSAKDGKFIRYEEGENKIVRFADGVSSIFTFNGLNSSRLWRAAGVSLPVFSLRTSKSRGCGEFSDLKELADWCAAAHLKVIQLLPINDTTATRQWRDSYPYNAISIMALHPNYVAVEEVFLYYGKRLCGMEREAGLYINDSKLLEYVQVVEWKTKNLRSLFNDAFYTITGDQTLGQYLKDNAYWVKDYAAFCTLRDKYGTPKFREWPEYDKHSAADVEAMFEPSHPLYREVLYWVFIQFHLERQLLDAVSYVHSKGIALKGDLPIGINPNSVEAWTSSELFDFGMQAGAPPDFFSHDGQNWGFPTYRWDVMAQDGYAWWERRMNRMQMFFDAFRIDHILGFFRIWSIPFPFRSGLMGLFSPSLPFSVDELNHRGFGGYINDYAVPVITDDFLRMQLSEYADAGYALFDRCFDGGLKLKREFFNPDALERWMEMNVDQNARERIRRGFANIIHEVLFVSVKEGEYHPRILVEETDRFRRLPDNMKWVVRDLYNDYFYRRHEEFWKRSAEEHLGGLLKNCRMLVCGEDLGMIPSTVPMVMKRLQILSLELQRMPKEDWQRFGSPSYYPYMSVCASSSHDISGIRGWWEEDRADVEWYYRNVMHRGDELPKIATPDIASFVVNQHLHSGSMLCINPIQDYAAMVEEVPRLFPYEERINVPSNPDQKWRYRVPFCIDHLISGFPRFHQTVAKCVDESGRN